MTKKEVEELVPNQECDWRARATYKHLHWKVDAAMMLFKAYAKAHECNESDKSEDVKRQVQKLLQYMLNATDELHDYGCGALGDSGQTTFYRKLVMRNQALQSRETDGSETLY